MAQVVSLKAAGLSLTDNELTADGGSLKVAQNLIMDRGNIYRSRRGMPVSSYGYASALTVDNIVNYATALYAGGVVGTNLNAPLLAYQSSLTSSYAFVGASSPFTSATYLLGPATPGTPMRMAEANKNLYVSTWQGVQRIDKAGSGAMLAGMARAWDANPVIRVRNEAGIAGTYNTGFLQADSACAYRVVWGYKDRNGAIVLGPPSGRATVRNPKYKTAQIKKDTGLGVSVVDINNPNVTALPDVFPSNGNQSFIAGDNIDISPSNAKNSAPTLKTIAATGAGNTSNVTAGGGSQIYYATDAASDTTYTTGYTLSLGMRPVRVSFTVPARFTNPDYAGQFFVRVYRSKLAASADSEPSEEMYLCYETSIFGSPSGSPVSLSFTDLTPDALLGEALYTSPTQEGALQANYMPPVCEDVALFAGSLFFANTRQIHRFGLQILSVGGTGVLAGESFTIGSETYTAVASTATPTSTQFRVFTDASLSQQQQLRLTCQSLVQTINSYSSVIRAYYVSGPGEAAGKLMFEAINPGHVYTSNTLSNGFSVKYSATKTCFIPSLPSTANSNITGSLARDGSTGLQVLTVAAGHGVSAGEYIQVATTSAAANLTLGLKRVVATTSTTLTIYDPYISGGGAGATGTYYKSTVYSDDEARPHRLYFSKTGIPEAVPLLNYLDIGSANYAIRRIATVGTSLFVFKDDGIFRVTGYDTSSLQVEAFDPTVKLLAYNSLAKLANFIYCWSNQGVVAVNESGVQVLSRPIDSALLSVVPALVSANSLAAGVGYESERLYLLCLSGGIYVYNLLAQAWTEWTFSGVRGGVVDVDSDQLLLWGSNSTAPRLENKTRTSADFHDGGGTVGLSSCSDLVLSTYGYYTFSVTVSTPVLRGAKLTLNNGTYAGKSFYATADSAGLATMMIPKADYNAGIKASINLGGITATFTNPVPVRLDWTAQTLENPQLSKHWRELSLFVNNDSFGVIRSQFDSDLSRTTADTKLIVSTSMYSTTGAQANKGSARTVLIPRASQRASQLTCRVLHNFSGQEFFTQGMALSVTPYGGEAKVRRG